MAGNSFRTGDLPLCGCCWKMIFRLVYILLLMDYKITLLSIRLVAVMENSSLEAIKATIVFSR